MKRLLCASMFVLTIAGIAHGNDDEILWNGVTRVLREGSIANERLEGYGLNNAFAYALATMNYTMGMVSTPLYSWYAAHGDVPDSSPESILEYQAGLCQSAQIVFMAIAERIGLPSRVVAIWYPEAYPDYTGPGIPGHATVEVYYGNQWHWFDPTEGSFYRDPLGRVDNVLSLRQVLSLTKEQRIQYKNSYQSLLWQQVMTITHYPIDAFLDYEHLTIQSPYGHTLYQR